MSPPGRKSGVFNVDVVRAWYVVLRKTSGENSGGVRRARLVNIVYDRICGVGLIFGDIPYIVDKVAALRSEPDE